MKHLPVHVLEQSLLSTTDWQCLGIGFEDLDLCRTQNVSCVVRPAWSARGLSPRNTAGAPGCTHEQLSLSSNHPEPQTRFHQVGNRTSSVKHTRTRRARLHENHQATHHISYQQALRGLRGKYRRVQIQRTQAPSNGAVFFSWS